MCPWAVSWVISRHLFCHAIDLHKTKLHLNQSKNVYISRNLTCIGTKSLLEINYLFAFIIYRKQLIFRLVCKLDDMMLRWTYKLRTKVEAAVV